MQGMFRVREEEQNAQYINLLIIGLGCPGAAFCCKVIPPPWRIANCHPIHLWLATLELETVTVGWNSFVLQFGSKCLLKFYFLKRISHWINHFMTTLFVGQPWLCWVCKILSICVNRPGVAGAILQSPPSFIHSFIHYLSHPFIR